MTAPKYAKRSYTIPREKWLHGGLRIVRRSARHAYAAHLKGGGQPLKFKDFDEGWGGTLYDAEVKRMCCLGVISNLEGVAKSRMEGSSVPSNCSAASHTLKLQGLLVPDHEGKYYDRLEERAASINDVVVRTLFGVQKKEAQLIALFKRHNVTLKFTGKHPKDLIVVA